MIHLRSITQKDKNEKEGFSFNVPVIRALDEIEFRAPVTFFVGENGSGKSTLMETIACAAGSVTVGSESGKTDPSLAHARSLAQHLRLMWTKRTHKGFFLRAEDFFGYAKQMAQTRQELEDDLRKVDDEYKGVKRKTVGRGNAVGLCLNVVCILSANRRGFSRIKAQLRAD